jgi:hypothetical protein
MEVQGCYDKLGTRYAHYDTCKRHFRARSRIPSCRLPDLTTADGESSIYGSTPRPAAAATRSGTATRYTNTAHSLSILPPSRAPHRPLQHYPRQCASHTSVQGTRASHEYTGKVPAAKNYCDIPARCGARYTARTGCLLSFRLCLRSAVRRQRNHKPRGKEAPPPIVFFSTPATLQGSLLRLLCDYSVIFARQDCQAC